VQKEVLTSEFSGQERTCKRCKRLKHVSLKYGLTEYEFSVLSSREEMRYVSEKKAYVC